MVGWYHEVEMLGIIVVSPGIQELTIDEERPLDEVVLFLGGLNSPPPGGL